MKLIEIVFTGLIAFVPDKAEDPSRLTAYLVPEEQHIPQLRVYGDVEIVTSGGSLCVKDGLAVTCNLRNVDLELLGALGRERRSLKRKTQKIRPANTDERDLLDWIVRMEEVQLSAGKISPNKERLEKLFGSGFRFSWVSARTTHLDGEELVSDPSKIPLIKFKSSEGKESRFSRVVAEGVNFTAYVANPVVIKLKDRRSGKRVEIRAKCSDRPECLGIFIDNSSRHQGCNPDEDGDHFLEYYGLVRSPGKPEDRMRPYRASVRECPHYGPLIGNSLFDTWLRLIDPALPAGLRDSIRDRVPERPIPLADLEKLLANLFSQHYSEVPQLARHSVASKFDAFISVLKIQDRVVCPPVLLSP